MAWRRITRRAATFVAAGLLLLFGGLQTGPGQRLLFNTVASIASTPGQAVRLDGPSGFFPTDMKLARVEVADGKGVWLAADDVSVSWSLWSLLSGEFDVESMRAARLAIHRAPETPTTGRDAASGSGAPQLPRVTVGSFAIDELRLGAALTGVESRWRLEGMARLDGVSANNTLSLAATRSDDRRGRLELRARLDATRGEAHADGNFEEGEGGVLAALLGRPDLPRTAGTFTLQASRDGGDGRITLDAGDALHVSGSGRMRPEDSGRLIVLSLEIRGGRLPYPTWATALVRPATVDADLRLGPTGAIELRTLRVASAPLEVTASGRYDQQTERLQLQLAAIGGDPAVLAALMPGATWRDLRIELQAEGRLAAINATLSLRAAELEVPQARATDVDLTASTQGANLSGRPALRATLKSRLGLLAWRTDKDPLTTRDLQLDAIVDRTAAGVVAINSLDIASTLLTASGRGRLGADGAVAANATIDVPDVSVLNTIVQWPIAGSARINATLSGTRDKPAVMLESTMRDAAVATVPPALIAPVVTATATGSVDRQGAWRLEKATVTSDAMSVQASGAGRHTEGTLDVAFNLPKLEALDPRAAGRLSGDLRIETTTEQRTVRLKAQLTEARVDRAAIERLGLDANILLRRDGFDATLDMDGASGQQPLRARGRVTATAGERLLIPSLEASLGTTNLSVRDLAIDRTSATGSARLVVEDLKQLGALAHQQTAGRLELTIVPDPEANGSQLKIEVRGSDLAIEGTAIGALVGEATLADPLGQAAFDAKLSAKGLRGVDDFRTLALKAAGDRTALTATIDLTGTSTNASSTLKARFEEAGTVVDIEALKGNRAGRPFALAQPGRLRYAGGRMLVEPLRLTVASGQVRVAGVVGVRDSDLAIDLAALSLADLAGLAGVDQPLSGSLEAQLRVRGDAANPRIEATYAVRDARLRRIETASVPAIALTGKATLAYRDLTAEAQLAAGGNNVALSASARLPAQGGAPDGRIKLTGPLDLAIFASLLGPDIQQVGGRAVLDVTISERAGRLGGTGTVRLEGLALALPSEGLVLSQGTGLVRLLDDKIVIERLAFPAVGKGDIAMSGEVRLDRALSWPLDLRLETRNARLVNRRDLVAELTSTLRLSGSVAEGLSLQGPIRIERAAINAAIGGVSKAVPAVPVREVGVGAPKRIKAPAPTKPLALDLKVTAPQAVFVRGKGLDSELGGEFTVAGTTANPTVIGGLQMRRGTYTLLGRSLGFARSSVTFTSVDRIVPLLDLLATTRSGGIAIEVSVRGQASDPKIVLSSTPQLPQDEIMAQFLFGKRSAELGPSQLVEVAEALAELTGTASSAAALETLRKALGLDRLGIARGGQGGGNGLAGSGVEGGRYIGQGIYVGGRQGLQGDSRGVVQIEVIPHVKLEAEVGTRSTGRAGIALEYDY